MVRHCKVCGKEYETCYVCERDRSWRMHTCTADHYFIFLTSMDFQVFHDAEKSYMALENRGFDFSTMREYVPEVRKILRDIYNSYQSVLSRKQNTKKSDGKTDVE